jgi:hypothetical protein
MAQPVHPDEPHRIGGTIIVLIGLAIWHSDWARPGFDRRAALALIGLAVSFGGPHFLARRWKTPPNP